MAAALRVLVLEDGPKPAHPGLEAGGAGCGAALDSLGLAWSGAASGAEALRELAAGGFGALVVPVHHPTMGALELLERADAAGDLAGVAVVVVAAQHPPGDLDRALRRAGAAAFVEHPVHPSRLGPALLLARRQAREPTAPPRDAGSEDHSGTFFAPVVEEPGLGPRQRVESEAIARWPGPRVTALLQDRKGRQRAVVEAADTDRLIVRSFFRPIEPGAVRIEIALPAGAVPERHPPRLLGDAGTSEAIDGGWRVPIHVRVASPVDALYRVGAALRGKPPPDWSLGLLGDA